MFPRWYLSTLSLSPFSSLYLPLLELVAGGGGGLVMFVGVVLVSEDALPT